MAENNRNNIIDAITRMLARREHSAAEIGRKLLQKGFEEQEYAPIIEEFTEANIQSDTRYAEAKVRAAVAKGSGPRKLQAELAQHDIDEHTLQLAIREIEPDWYALASRVREKKFGLSEPDDFKQAQKQKQFLQYRGFLQSHIQFAMGRE